VAIGIITALGGLISLAIMIWRFIARMKRNRRKMADEGKAKIEKATSKDGSASDLLDGFSKL